MHCLADKAKDLGVQLVGQWLVKFSPTSKKKLEMHSNQVAMYISTKVLHEGLHSLYVVPRSSAMKHALPICSLSLCTNSPKPGNIVSYNSI